MPGYDVNVGAKRARAARAALGLAAEEPFACLLTAIERDARVPVVVAGMPDEVAGFCLRPGDGSSCLFVNGLQYAGRQRFTLAHEYGHHVMRHEGVPPDSTRTVIHG
ncbi:MAG: ImmA/IrrE family metallo-endopeptidase, partial [Solirubrobacteraceae bacterium]